jgi:hypothetical protein
MNDMTEMIAFLLQQDSDAASALTRRDLQGNTAAMWAAREDSFDAVSLRDGFLNVSFVFFIMFFCVAEHGSELGGEERQL